MIKLLTNRLSIVLILLGILLLMLFPYWKDYRDLKRQKKMTPILKQNEKSKIIIEDKKVIIVSKDKTKIKQGVRDIAVTVKDDGTVDVYAPELGFTFEPGYCGFYAKERFYGGIDIQWAYWRNFGLYSGIGITGDSDDLFGAFNIVGIGYTLPWKLMSNTTVFTAINDSKKFSAGIRVRW